MKVTSGNFGFVSLALHKCKRLREEIFWKSSALVDVDHYGVISRLGISLRVGHERNFVRMCHPGRGAHCGGQICDLFERAAKNHSGGLGR